MEQMVMSNEVIDMLKRILRGIPVTDDTRALNVIDEIGPGGHFLEHDHTYTRFKTEIWKPQLIDRQNYENWEASGSKAYRDRAREKVIEVIEAETEPLIDENMYNELRKICELADERHAGEELDMDMFGS